MNKYAQIWNNDKYDAACILRTDNGTTAKRRQNGEIVEVVENLTLKQAREKVEEWYRAGLIVRGVAHFWQ